MSRLIVAVSLIFNLTLLFFAERNRGSWQDWTDSYTILFLSLLLLIWPWLLAFMRAVGESRAQSLTFATLSTLLAVFIFKPIAEEQTEVTGFVTLTYFLYCWIIYWILALFFYVARLMSTRGSA